MLGFLLDVLLVPSMWRQAVKAERQRRYLQTLEGKRAERTETARALKERYLADRDLARRLG